MCSSSDLMCSFTVADVPDAETHYHAHEFLDVTVQPKPIYISPNEVYGMHALLSKYLDKLVRNCILLRLLASDLSISRLPVTMPCVSYCTS